MSNHDDRPGGSGLLLGAGAALLMVACCALLPILIAGGAIAGIGAFLRNPWVIGAGIALAILALIAISRRGGGTAGHINPALAAAGYLRSKQPDAEILYVGNKGGMEERLVPAAGYDFKTIRIFYINHIGSTVNTRNNTSTYGIQKPNCITYFHNIQFYIQQ